MPDYNIGEHNMRKWIDFILQQEEVLFLILFFGTMFGLPAILYFLGF